MKTAEELNVNGFRHYRKVQRLGKEETEGILEGMVHVQEKVDGANTQIWLDEKGEIKLGSRTRVLGEEEFNGFVKYAKEHAGIKTYLEKHPTHRLYGEWLVRHTIAYKETAYKKWYMFDIWNGEKFLTSADVKNIGELYQIETVPYHGAFANPTLESIKEFVGKTAFGDRGEGVVLKNFEFVSKFGDLEFGKIVTESFKEDNGVTFGGNNKHSDTYHEMWAVNKYMTMSRVKKIMDKIQPEIDKKLDMEHIPRIINTCYHDMITEEAWEIATNVPTINFPALKRIATKKAKQIFVDIINDDVSVADKKDGKTNDNEGTASVGEVDKG